jgi:UDP-N-acetylglucosamine enolpyruvyl transferase
MVPRPPTPAEQPEDGIEGWRAVLTVVLRHGLSERQRMARFSLPGGGDEVMREIDSELVGVEAMVAGVKSKGVS